MAISKDVVKFKLNSELVKYQSYFDYEIMIKIVYHTYEILSDITMQIYI